MRNLDPTHFPQGARIAVLTAEPAGMLDYLAPEGGATHGQIVMVPLGPRQVPGVVWGAGQSNLAQDRLRFVTRLIDLPPLNLALLDFIDRASRYTLTDPAMMLRMVLRVPDLGRPPAERRVISRIGAEPARMTEARQNVLRALDQAGPAVLGQSDLAELAGVGTAVVKGLITAGTLGETREPRDPPYPRLEPDRPGKTLSPEQASAAQELRHAVIAGGYGTTLLRGVTGSGKTEVYFEAIAACLEKGKQALVLLPEIALSAEFLARVEARFGARPGAWHSAVPRAERRRLWHACIKGTVGLVAGARSALFLPFRDLGLIVVDEEHETSYKQEDSVFYHARDMAVLRASLTQARTVLASATPSLESWVNARTGKYGLLELTARHGQAEMPKMGAIDLRRDAPPPGRWISPVLEGMIRDRIARGEQSLLFLNRRGYAPVTICRACGEQVGCAHCDARMVEHRARNCLMCHQCGATRPIPDICPSCEVEGRMAPVGPGVERIEEETASLFPDARRMVLSSDLFANAQALKDAIADIASGGADIVIGTQMVAKGHNFPALTLVGVIDADLGLQGADLRAAERSFQLMRQVAGRAGRGKAGRGVALLQTHQPDHPVIRAILAGEETAFWDAEAAARRQAEMPPFGRLAGIILSHPDPAILGRFGQQLAEASGPLVDAGIALWGPAPAPIARIRGRYRLRMLAHAPRSIAVQDAITAWLAPHKRPPNLRLNIDIDPQSFL